MAQSKEKRRWVRRLVVLAVLVGIVAVARDRQFARNEEQYAATPG